MLENATVGVPALSDAGGARRAAIRGRSRRNGQANPTSTVAPFILTDFTRDRAVACV